MYPHGIRVPYSGQLESVSFSAGGPFSCDYGIGPEPNSVWIRINGGLTTVTDYLAPDTYEGCQGIFRIGGQDYPFSVELTVHHGAAVSVTNNAGVEDADLPHCQPKSDKPRVFYSENCQESDLRPGGSFNMPQIGGSYRDSFGTNIRVLTYGSGNHYASITPFNLDETLVLLEDAIYRVADGVKMYTYKPDNVCGPQCWFDFVPGYTNTLTCYDETLPIYGGNARIMRYTLPDTCESPPCAIDSGVEIYKAPAPYNQLTKGGTSGPTTDGWNVWGESTWIGTEQQYIWRICAANLAVPPGMVNPICYSDFKGRTGMDSFDYVTISKSFDKFGIRHILAASADPTAGVFAFSKGDSELTFYSNGLVRGDFFNNRRMRPKCEDGVEDVNFCMRTPHGDTLTADGNSYFVGDGGPQIPYGGGPNSWRLSGARPEEDGGKKWYVDEELGGGQQYLGGFGGYLGCALFSPICVTTDYSLSRAPTGLGGSPSSCSGGVCTLRTSSDHAFSVGQEILIGANTVGITPGTVATIASVPSSTSLTFSSSVVGEGNSGWIILNQKLDSNPGNELAVVRKFGSLGVQIHRFADVRTVSYFGYGDYPKPCISPSGRYVLWGANNGIPGVGYALIAETGLGTPPTSSHFNSSDTSVSVQPSSSELQFTLNIPDPTKTCTLRVSENISLRGGNLKTQSVPSGSSQQTLTVSGLQSGTQHYWRAQCGVHIAAGTVNTL